MTKLTFIILLILTVSAKADLLQCIDGSRFNCTAHDITYLGYCEQVEARNKEFAEQVCPFGKDKCLLFASKLSFQDKFDLQLVIATCGTGTLDGCNNRQELLAINPNYGKIGQGLTTPFGDNFSGDGYEYDSLDVCVCGTDLCVGEDEVIDFQIMIFGNHASHLCGNFYTVYSLIIFGVIHVYFQ